MSSYTQWQLSSRECVIAVQSMENAVPGQYLMLASFWDMPVVPRGFRVARAGSCCCAGGHRALPTLAQEDTPKQAEPWQDVLHAEK